MDRNYAVYKLWLQEDQKTPFRPPFTVYANQDFEDEDRLKYIRDHTRQLKSVLSEDYDFLRPDQFKNQTNYKIHFNAEGFRNTKDYNLKKDPNTFRIITYGSYTAFGHGVDTDKTYSSYLETLLNLKDPSTNYQVFNAGQHAGSVMVALAHLQDDIKRYKPDAIIADYGFVDDLIFDDYSMPLAFKFRSWVVRTVVRTLPKAVMLNSLVLANFVRWHYQYFQDRRAKNFTEGLKRVTELCKQEGVKAIVLRQLPALIGDKRFLPAITDEQTQVFVDVDHIFRKVYDEIAKDKIGWQSQLPDVVKKTRLESREFKYPLFKINPWHLNSMGHFELATGLSHIILNRKTAWSFEDNIKMQYK